MSHWYIQQELAPDSSWSSQSTYATWQGWLAPINAGFLEASEDPFDLNVKPEDLDIVPEKFQAGEIKWTAEREPTPSWTNDDEDQYEDWWYLQPEPTYFYWDGISEPTSFYWDEEDESTLDFYQIEVPTAPAVQWTAFYYAPSRFYIQPEPIDDYWYILEEPEDI